MSGAKIFFALYGSFPQFRTGYAVRSHELIKALSALGHEIFACAMPGFGQADQSQNAPLEYDGVVYHRLPRPEEAGAGKDCLMAARRVYAQAIRESGAEIVHAASNFENAWPAVMAAKDCGLPSIYEYRGMWHYTRASAIPWYRQEADFSWRHKMELETGRQASQVIAISAALARDLAANGLDGNKITLAPNGAPACQWHLPRNESLARNLGLGGKKVLGYTGSINAYEGLGNLIDATLSLREQGWPVALLIVGNGPDLSRLQRLAEARKAGADIVFTGYAPPQDIPHYYSIIDIIVNPRIPCLVTNVVPPLKPLEAMAAGKPVVMTDLPPLQEMARHGVNALLCQPGCRSSLAKELARLLGDASLREKIAANGKKWVLENRQWSQTAGAISSLYQKLRPFTKPAPARAQIRYFRPPDFVPATREKRWRKPSWPWLRVAAIMDEFTYGCFQPECLLLQLEPEKWREQLEEFQPDLLFVESAWFGKNGLWNQKISGCAPELQALFAWCRGENIPSLFWNKEDPGHFNTFLKTAALADYIFTADIDCVPAYKHDLGNDNTFFLPFGVQPAHNNPLATRERKDGFCFAGTWYKRYTYRQKVFEDLFNALRDLGDIAIYDRNFVRKHSDYAFPARYAKYIKGYLEPAEIDIAYKGYRYGLSLNTSGQAQGMFARRAYELAASNTIVIANYSRGLRNIFGDLAISTDNPGELRRRLLPILHNESEYRKLRLAALRHVMGRHTMQDRLASIRQRIWGEEPAAPPLVGIVAVAGSPDDARSVLAAFRRQNWPNKRLILCGAVAGLEPCANVAVCYSAKAAPALAARFGFAWLSEFKAGNYYGKNYLTDLVLTGRYAQAGIIGKKARFQFASGAARLVNDGSQYRATDDLPLGACLVKAEAKDAFWQAFLASAAKISGDCLAIDEFSFLEGSPLPKEEVDADQDAHDLFKAGQMRELHSPQLTPAYFTGKAADASQFFIKPMWSQAAVRDERCVLRTEGSCLALASSLPEGESLLVPGSLQRRGELNLLLTCQLNIRISGAAETRLVSRYFDAAKKLLASEELRPGARLLTIPDACEYIRLDIKVTGPGEATIRPFSTPRLFMNQPLLTLPSSVAILAKRYPDYGALYNYGFVHARMLGYRKDGKDYAMLVSDDSGRKLREFQNIEVSCLSHDDLALNLAHGRIKTLAVHLISPRQWEAIKPYLGQVQLAIWIHGAEIQSWQRREFEFPLLDKGAREQMKRNSNANLAMWQDVLARDAPNMRYIFVSQKFREESEADVGRQFPEGRTHIIHNFIDTDFFAFQPREAEDRFRVILARPFDANKYGNDLAVRAILQFSGHPLFEAFSFSIFGAGKLFDATLKPLRQFANVKIVNKFLTRAELRAQFGKHGVCLIPTRMDSQGVTRDEAMSCGLVPITNAVCGVPEFVDETCGFVCPPEDVDALATALARIADNPALFLRLSANAAKRVRALSGFELTIKREIELLETMRSQVGN